MRKFLVVGLVFLAIAAGLTFYFRQRSPHRSGRWTIEPGYGVFYTLHASGLSRFNVQFRPTSPGRYGISHIDAATKAKITFPVRDFTSLKLANSMEVDGPNGYFFEFNPSPDYLFIYNPGTSSLTIAYDIEKLSG